MKKIILSIVFTAGLGIFLYPIVSDYFSTTAHQTVIEEYHESISKADKQRIEKEKEKIREHNAQLASSGLNFVDPFDETGSEHSSGNSSYYDALNLGPSLGIVKIPSLDIELPIYHGTTEEVLSQGAGHLENSSLPSSDLGIHSVITAHRGLPSARMFRDLDDMKKGDLFFVEVLDEVLAYKVETIEVVLPHETTWIMMDETKNKVTLLTCDPYMINTHRMLVTGYQVPYEKEVEASYQQSIDEKSGSPMIFIVLGVLIILLGLCFSIWKRKKDKKKDGDLE